MRRRRFLASCGALAAGAAAPASAPADGIPPGRLEGTDLTLGHRLRQRDFPAPRETRRVPVLVVGAGIGGLSAGWRLQRAGYGDFEILELESRPGGNSRHGENPVSTYPVGAHYLPLPPREATAVRLLLADLGAIDGDPLVPRPRYDEALLCHAPQERLYRDGLWQEGVIPRLGLTAAERDQIRRFLERMAEYRHARDARGRRAFALPIGLASPEPRWRELDTLTMRDWMLREGFDAVPLHWYVNYACRDDFGTDHRQASAWAGIHYFACRDGEAADAAPDVVLTAPEGNGWIVRRLVARLAARLRTGATVFSLRQFRTHMEADVWIRDENRSVRLRAERLVWAAPLFLLPVLADDLPPALGAATRGLSHAPWLVANLTLREPPAPGAGAGLAWDNVLYDGAGLGYVVATHQRFGIAAGPTVLTYYRALSEADPRAARERLLATDRPTWAREVLADLSRAHRDLPAITASLDVFRHGHAMARPLPGFLARNAAFAGGWDRIQFAHADASGLSLFEEAHWQGVRAAERTLAGLGHRVHERLA